jgi:hypothetical protein
VSNLILRFKLRVYPCLSTPGQSALLIGATGATGKHVLRELLSSPHFTHVGEYGRRVTPLDQISSGKEKLEQKIVDFEKLEDAGLKAGNWDVVFITYGLYSGKVAHITDMSPGWELRKVLLDQQQPSRKLIGSE